MRRDQTTNLKIGPDKGQHRSKKTQKAQPGAPVPWKRSGRYDGLLFLTHRLKLATSEELPVHMDGAKFQPKAEIRTPLRLAIDNSGPRVNTARQRRDADPIILLPSTLGFHVGAAGD